MEPVQTPSLPRSTRLGGDARLGFTGQTSSGGCIATPRPPCLRDDPQTRPTLRGDPPEALTPHPCESPRASAGPPIAWAPRHPQSPLEWAEIPRRTGSLTWRRGASPLRPDRRPRGWKLSFAVSEATTARCWCSAAASAAVLCMTGHSPPFGDAPPPRCTRCQHAPVTVTTALGPPFGSAPKRTGLLTRGAVVGAAVPAVDGP